MNNKIIFLRKLQEGGSEHSFGIHVARMAGMPPALINRATEILHQLEEKNISDSDTHTSIREKVKDLSGARLQLSIFDEHTAAFEEIRNLLSAADINRLTPVEALLKLQEIKSKLG